MKNWPPTQPQVSQCRILGGKGWHEFVFQEAQLLSGQWIEFLKSLYVAFLLSRWFGYKDKVHLVTLELFTVSWVFDLLWSSWVYMGALLGWAKLWVNLMNRFIIVFPGAHRFCTECFEPFWQVLGRLLKARISKTYALGFRCVWPKAGQNIVSLFERKGRH